MDIDAWEVRSLDREAVQRLSRRADMSGFLQLAAHLGLLGTTTVLVWASRGHPWLAAALIVHGVVLVFLFCALHETTHRTAFSSRWPNQGVAWIGAAVLMLPPEYFRLFHFAHHRYTQDPARDPELAQPAPASVASYLWRVSGFPYWHDRLSVTLRHALTGRVSEPFVPPQAAARVVGEA